MARRPGLTRTRVVDAAAAIVDTEGLGGLTLAVLAKALGVRTPSLYNHVDGLDDLLGALRLRGLEGLERTLERSAVGRARGDAVRALARAYRAFAGEHPGLYALTLAAPSGRGEGSDEAGPAAADAAATAAVAGRLVEVVVSVLRGYGLEQDDALHATRALRASLHGFVALEAAGAFGLPLDLDVSFERLVDQHDAALTARGG